MHKRFFFVCNFSSEALAAAEVSPVPAWLLSIAERSPSLREKARSVSRKGKGIMVADNGNASIILSLIAKFSAEADSLHGAWKKAGDAKAVSVVRAKYRDLASRVRSVCLNALSDADPAEMVAAQSSFAPTFFICQEDLTVPVLTSLGIDQERLGYPPSFFIGTQISGVSAAVRTARGEFGPYVGIPYATVHGVDHATAYDVGYYAGLEDGIDSLSTGLASFMNDPAFITSYEFRGRRVEIAGGKTVPRRYLRALQASIGLVDGFRDASGRTPNFHGLGLGSPIMLPLLALALEDVPVLTVDSTAPLKNANMGKLMLDDPAYMNGTIEDIVNDIVTKGFRWTHRCAHCRAFTNAHPFRYDEAIAYHRNVLRGKKVRKDDLAKKDGIASFLPMFYDLSAVAGTPLRAELHRQRIGHNHAVLLELSAKLDARRDSKKDLRAFALARVEEYRRVAAESYPPYAAQIDECLRLIALARGEKDVRDPSRKSVPAPSKARVRDAADSCALATIGLEKAAIVAAVSGFAATVGKDRAAYGTVSAAAWRAMRASTAAGDASAPDIFSPRDTANGLRPETSAIVASLRAFADVAEPLAMTGLFLTTAGGDKGRATETYVKDAERARRCVADVRERVLAFAESLDGKKANITIDHARWEKEQKAVARGTVPSWMEDGLRHEGFGPDERAEYLRWFAKYYRKRVKPQKTSYMLRIAYHELRKAEEAVVLSL